MRHSSARRKRAPVHGQVRSPTPNSGHPERSKSCGREACALERNVELGNLCYLGLFLAAGSPGHLRAPAASPPVAWSTSSCRMRLCNGPPDGSGESASTSNIGSRGFEARGFEPRMSILGRKLGSAEFPFLNLALSFAWSDGGSPQGTAEE